MKYLILLVISTCLATVIALKCDSYYQYQVGGFQTQSFDNVISGCTACGYLYSNTTGYNSFRGFFSGCLSSTKTLAQTYDSKLFNMTEFEAICNKNNKLGVPYCQEYTVLNNNASQTDSKICCCPTDLCTRVYYQK
uniref:Uncharacterized protein n=1 Tax=Strongyloides venezuelensis TaxID=75913 RepID=A0A0K0FKR0_STRVS